MYKKILTLLLIVALMLTIVGCNKMEPTKGNLINNNGEAVHVEDIDEPIAEVEGDVLKEQTEVLVEPEVVAEPETTTEPAPIVVEPKSYKERQNELIDTWNLKLSAIDYYVNDEATLTIDKGNSVGLDMVILGDRLDFAMGDTDIEEDLWILDETQSDKIIYSDGYLFYEVSPDWLTIYTPNNTFLFQREGSNSKQFPKVIAHEFTKPEIAQKDNAESLIGTWLYKDYGESWYLKIDTNQIRIAGIEYDYKIDDNYLTAFDGNDLVFGFYIELAGGGLKVYDYSEKFSILPIAVVETYTRDDSAIDSEIDSFTVQSMPTGIDYKVAPKFSGVFGSWIGVDSKEESEHFIKFDTYLMASIIREGTDGEMLNFYYIIMYNAELDIFEMSAFNFMGEPNQTDFNVKLQNDVLYIGTEGNYSQFIRYDDYIFIKTTNKENEELSAKIFGVWEDIDNGMILDFDGKNISTIDGGGVFYAVRTGHIYIIEADITGVYYFDVIKFKDINGELFLEIFGNTYKRVEATSNIV